MKRGAGAFHNDFLKLFGFAPETPKSKEPYAEKTKYPKAPGDGKAWRRLWGGLGAAGGSIALLGAGAALTLAFVIMAPRVDMNADLWNVNRQAAIIVLDRNGEEIASRGATSFQNALGRRW